MVAVQGPDVTHPLYIHTWGSRCIDPLILGLGTSRPDLFTPGERARSTHWIGGWVGPKTSLNDVERRKILPLPEHELLPFGRPARSQSVYRLCYHYQVHVLEIVHFLKYI
jgi:hypothetical protein